MFEKFTYPKHDGTNKYINEFEKLIRPEIESFNRVLKMLNDLESDSGQIQIERIERNPLMGITPQEGMEF